MSTELRKRFEEAAKKSWKKRYPKGLDIYKDAQIDGFLAGVEHGYKEAIEQAKEWLMNYFFFDNSLMSASGCDLFLRRFEADMNKLLEGEK